MSDTDVPSYSANQRLLDPRRLGTTTMLSSTSKYLNHPRLRHWMAVECLRRNGPDMDHYGGPLEIIDIFRELDDVDEINRLFAEARSRDPALDTWFEARFLVPHDLEALASGIARFGCHYPHLLPPLYKALGEGHRIGNSIKIPLFMPRYEDMFEWTIAEVRAHLGVVQGPDFEDTMWCLGEYFDAA